MPLTWDFAAHWFASFGAPDQRLPEQRRNTSSCGRAASEAIQPLPNRLQVRYSAESRPGCSNSSLLVEGSNKMTASTRPSSGDDRNRKLTKRQQDILTYVRKSTKRRGHGPSMREIADAVGLRSTSAVSHQLTILERKGYLTRGARMPRTVVEKLPAQRLVQERWDEAGEAPADFGSQNTVGVPMFERMAAGDPVTANPESVGTIWLPREMIGSGVFFAVRVVGDSMEKVDISDGDWALVRQQDEAHNGDIVVALIEGEATVKTFFRASGHTWLIPQNTGYEPIPGDRCRLLGKVVRTISRI